MKVRLAIGLFALGLVLAGGADAWGKAARRKRGLTRKQCAGVCQQLVACEGMSLADSATLAEYMICVDDCEVESKGKKTRGGWFCAADAKGCDALRACEPGGPGRTEAGRMHSG